MRSSLSELKATCRKIFLFLYMGSAIKTCMGKVGMCCRRGELPDGPDKSKIKPVPRGLLFSLLREKFGNIDNIDLRDGDYFCLNKSEYMRLVSGTSVDMNEYKAEIYDCDNFADALTVEMNTWVSQLKKDDFHDGAFKALAFGYISGELRDKPGNYHAINVGIVWEETYYDVVLVEPQSSSEKPKNLFSKVNKIRM
jgi:hypothetical protein